MRNWYAFVLNEDYKESISGLQAIFMQPNTFKKSLQ